MSRRTLLVVAVVGVTSLLVPVSHAVNVGFVQANGTRFELDGQPHYYLGASYFNAMNEGADCATRPVLDATFERLSELGITNVRIWASSEGAGGTGKLTPTLQPSAGTYSQDMFAGLDYALKSANDHDLRCVMVLTNCWDWSGGMNEYVDWSPTTNKSLTNLDWGQGDLHEGQGAYHDQFYTDANCQATYLSFIDTIVNRENTAYPEGSQPLYKDDPTIFSWELANEPRAHDAGQTVLSNWIDSTAAYIKSLDSNHMVSTGSEGFFNRPGSSHWWENPQYSGTDFVANHSSAYIDYATVHIWPYNWGWYRTDMEETFQMATDFLEEHVTSAEDDLAKPLVLEEFGLLRDNDHDGDGSEPPGSPTTERDELYQRYFNILYASASSDGAAAGSNFWTYDKDPPQEPEGMNAVYDPEDNSTLTILYTEASRMNGLIPVRGDADGNGLIDGVDLAIWQENYDPLGLNPNNTFELGDWDGDGDIDGVDLALWQENYCPLGYLGEGASSGLGDGTRAVPEPGTLALVLAAWFGWCIARRTRR